jgi:hypothetical protein
MLVVLDGRRRGALAKMLAGGHVIGNLHYFVRDFQTMACDGSTVHAQARGTSVCNMLDERLTCLPT